jgi:hypothetical protein
MTSNFNERHPSVEELIQALEGELDKNARVGIAAHLEVCWGCRHKHERLRRTIDRYAEMASSGWHCDEASPRWNGFAGRLAAATAHSPATRRMTPFAGFSLAGALAALVAVLLWPVPTVSAMEAIRRSAAAERAMELLSPRTVTMQRIQVEASTRRSQGRVWRAAAHRPRWQPEPGSDAKLWQELEAVYKQNDLDFSRPVSAANHSHWLAGNAAAGEAVDQEGGYLRIRMRSAAAAGPGDIIAAELVVRSTDWHPVEQTWMVNDRAGTRRYRVVETALEVGALTPQLANWMDGATTVAAVTLEHAPALETSHTPNPVLSVDLAAIPRWSPEQLHEAEVEALVAVHETGAADRDGARVERQDQRVLITTYPEDPSHLVTLKAAIEPGQPIHIQAAEEASESHQRVTKVVPQAPMAPLFLDQLVTLVGQERAANLMVSAQHAALHRVSVETAALADLAHRFPAASRAELPPATAARLEQLGEAHWQAARTAWAQAEANSRPLLTAAGVAAGSTNTVPAICRWTGASANLATTAARLEELYSRGFTALAGGHPALMQLSPAGWQEEFRGLHATVGAALAGHCEP